MIREQKEPRRTAQLLEDGTLYGRAVRAGRDLAGGFPCALYDAQRIRARLSVVAFGRDWPALCTAQQNGRVQVAAPRPGIAGQTADGGALSISSWPIEAARHWPQYLAQDGRPSSILCWGAVLVDAFLAGNLIGGTPCARPEDIEINPRNHARGHHRE